MSYLKKYGLRLFYNILEILLLILFMTTLYYFNIIGDKLYSFSKLIILLSSIFINSFILGRNTNNKGYLEGIIGTPYDFEGKAKFIKRIIEDKGIDPNSILYVGNSFNDEFVYLSGVETLCVNPVGTDFYNNKVWHNYIRRLVSLKEILPYVYGNK